MDFSSAVASVLLDPRAVRDEMCQSERASDYYGLGVRLGVYFAWLQAWVANAVLPSQTGSALNTNTVFLLTLLVAMVNDSVTGQLSQVDGLILMHLCGGTIFGVLSVWGYRTRLYTQQGTGAIAHFGGFGTHIRMVVALAVSSYGMWFWSMGVTGGLFPLGPGDGADPPNPPECGTLYTFFFAKVKASEGIRYYYLVICASCVLYFGIQLVASLLAAWFTIGRFFGTLHKRWTKAADIDKLSRPSYVTGFTEKELVMMHKFLRVGNLIWLLFSAVMVECTLNFNSIGGVLGGMGRKNTIALPGQLLPFLIGLLGFVNLMYTVFVEKYVNAQPSEMSALTAAVEASLQPAIVGAKGASGGADPVPMGPDGITTTPEVADAQSYRGSQIHRSWGIRYLVGWLPWLSLLQDYDKELLEQGISRQGTDLNASLASPIASNFSRNFTPLASPTWATQASQTSHHGRPKAS